FLELLDAAPCDRRDAKVGRDAQQLVVRVDGDGDGLAGRLDIKIRARLLHIERNGRQALIALGPKLNVDGQPQVVVILLDGPTRYKFAALCPQDHVIRGELRHTGRLDPAGKEITHRFARDARSKLFKIVDPRRLAAVFLQKCAQQRVEFL